MNDDHSSSWSLGKFAESIKSALSKKQSNASSNQQGTSQNFQQKATQTNPNQRPAQAAPRQLPPKATVPQQQAQIKPMEQTFSKMNPQTKAMVQSSFQGAQIKPVNKSSIGQLKPDSTPTRIKPADNQNSAQKTPNIPRAPQKGRGR